MIRRSTMLKAIVELKDSEQVQYQAIFEGAKCKYGETCNLCDEHRVESKHASNVHTGKVKDEYAEISPLELSMLLDNGFSHFGGSASISPDGSFTVIIYTD